MWSLIWENEKHLQVHPVLLLPQPPQAVQLLAVLKVPGYPQIPRALQAGVIAAWNKAPKYGRGLCSKGLGQNTLLKLWGMVPIKGNKDYTCVWESKSEAYGLYYVHVCLLNRPLAFFLQQRYKKSFKAFSLLILYKVCFIDISAATKTHTVQLH